MFPSLPKSSRHGTSIILGIMRAPPLNLFRSVSREWRPQAIGRLGVRHGMRWSSSSGGRQWSTPLAKSLAEAITVRPFACCKHVYEVLMIPTDNRPHICSFVHAPMPHLTSWWLLHSSNLRPRPVRRKRRLYNVPRDKPSLWRIGRNMALHRVAGTR